jgi:hypothetical protein
MQLQPQPQPQTKHFELNIRLPVTRDLEVVVQLPVEDIHMRVRPEEDSGSLDRGSMA